MHLSFQNLWTTRACIPINPVHNLSPFSLFLSLSSLVRFSSFSFIGLTQPHSLGLLVYQKPTLSTSFFKNFYLTELLSKPNIVLCVLKKKLVHDILLHSSTPRIFSAWTASSKRTRCVRSCLLLCSVVCVSE